MKHLIAGGVVASAFLATCLIWALLQAMVGPVWALLILSITAAIWMAGSILDYLTDERSG